MNKYDLYINGEWTKSVLGETFFSYNPANGEEIAQVERGNQEDINRAVAAAKAAFESNEWSEMKPSDRAKILNEIAFKIRESRMDLARLETLDTGKPLQQALNDVEAAAQYCEYYAGVADKILGETIPISYDILDYTMREPLGVTAQIIPWNYPIQITMRGIAPAIAAGNTVVVKPAEDTPVTALEVARIVEEIGVPKGVINVVTGFGNEAGEALSNHPDVNQITFTGSVVTGMKIMEAASRNIIPVTLELGGKSPNIVFADADLDDALEWVVRSIIQNAGQTCSAGARLLIEKSIHKQFVEKIVEKFSRLKVGPGIDHSDIGPIISKKQLERIKSYIELAKKDNLPILTGGDAPQDHLNGYFFNPTIIDNVTPEHRLAQEEIFGPVITVTPFETVEEAINIANMTEYGLVTGVWTENINKAHYVAKKVKAGQIFINNYGAGGGVAMPFGGYKKSGFGREKGLEALRQYTQLKNVAVKINTNNFNKNFV